MFKKQKKEAFNEGSIRYFVGGAAVGVAAGLAIGKFLSPNISTAESAASADQNLQVHSQDDNIYRSLHSRKNSHCYPRSKSASRCEYGLGKELCSTIESNKLLVINGKNDLNDLTTMSKNSTRFHNISNNNNECVQNISMDSNIINTLCNKKEEKQCNDYEQPKLQNVRGADKMSFKDDQSYLLANYLNNADNATVKTAPEKLFFNTVNSNETTMTASHLDISNSTKLSGTFQSLISSFCAKSDIITKQLENIHNSMVGSNKFQSDIKSLVEDITTKNISSSATCNTVINPEDVEEYSNLHSTSSDEFHESDLISSTKYNNLDNM